MTGGTNNCFKKKKIGCKCNFQHQLKFVQSENALPKACVLFCALFSFLNKSRRWCILYVWATKNNKRSGFKIESEFLKGLSLRDKVSFLWVFICPNDIKLKG